MSVALLMGSDSDFPRLEECVATLKEFGIQVTARVLSAHRTPEDLVRFVEEEGPASGVQVYICAAGGAAHLAGVVAAHTNNPVIGIPMDNPPLGGLDALLSTVQMPGGVPVATVGAGRGGPINAALLAVRILALGNEDLTARLAEFTTSQAEKVHAKDAALQARLG